MKPTIDIDDLDLVLDIVSAADAFGTSAYVCRENGRIFVDGDGADEELPEDIADDSRYVAVPHKRDLDLGQTLVWDFVEQYLPEQRHEVAEIFRRRGAYGRYKDLLDRRGLLDAWHAFEEERVRAALVEWAEQNGFDTVPGR